MKKFVVAIAAVAAMSFGVSGLAAASTKAHTTKHTAKAMKTVHVSAHVKALQEALDKNGAKLKADGRWGSKTRNALMAFQKKNGLKATGHLNKATDKKLGLK